MKILLRLVAALVVIGLAGAALLATRLNSPYQGFEQPVFLVVRRGMTSAEMAGELARNGVVRAPWEFLAARALQRGARLQAGEYRFYKPASPLEVLDRIRRGDIHFIELTLPEGLNIFDMAPLVEKQTGIRAADFLASARNPGPVRDLDPRAQSLEGYLFPSTYRVYRHTTAQQLCSQMLAEFRARWAKAGGTDVHRIVTLASLVEREARRREEQGKVASVFANRLRIGMKLDCDPTTVYAALLENRYRGAIHQSDLASPSPYNTYRHVGLPPGPIANPGEGAIRAALAPEATKYLYFVARADGTGGHYFSESLGQHAAAVRQYRAAVRK